jgi:Cu(I)/Ag(I) efflux system periplasmic protein CusF
MSSRRLRFLLVGLAPIALAACADIEPATGSPIPTAPLVGVDLGGSGRIPQIAGLVGEGEGYGRTDPGATPSEHGPMPGMGHGSKDHESMAGMSHGSMPGMSHGSQAQMAPAHGSITSMDHAKHKMRMAHSGHGHVQGTGTVNSVDAAAHKVNVSHGPIPTIGLPAMTMDFSVGPSVDLSAVKPGTRIKFDMEQAQDGSYVIQSIAPAGGRQ